MAPSSTHPLAKLPWLWKEQADDILVTFARSSSSVGILVSSVGCSCGLSVTDIKHEHKSCNLQPVGYKNRKGKIEKEDIFGLNDN